MEATAEDEHTSSSRFMMWQIKDESAVKNQPNFNKMQKIFFGDQTEKMHTKIQ